MWVRSQDKTILTNGIISYVIDESSIVIINENNSSPNYGMITIGEYSTEEKALKVLDMMEEFLNDNYELTVFQIPLDNEVL